MPRAVWRTHIILSYRPHLALSRDELLPGYAGCIMTENAAAVSRLRGPVARIFSSPAVLWSSFIVVHFWLGYLNLFGPNHGFGDVEYVYRYWAEQAHYADYWVGISGPFVYPILALVPILGASVFGFGLYGATWLSMVMVLNCAAFAVLTGRGKVRQGIAWWWIAFMLLVGPIAVSRIDAITVPLALVAVLYIARRPRIAALLLTLGAWIKIWPAAIVAAVVIASPARVRVVATAAVTSAVIVAIALAFGSGTNIFSFVSQQAGRGLQVEAPITTFWMWQAWAQVPGAAVYYDTDILTYQVTGAGVHFVAEVLMTPLLVLAVAAVCALGLLGVRRKTPVTELLAPLVLGLVAAMIAFNKVGSPQFMTWFIVPVILGLATRAAGHASSFRVPATLVLVLALMTQIIYPTFYDELIALQPVMILVLTVRNVLTFVLLGWALHRLWVLARVTTGHESITDQRSWLPVVWPFAGGAARSTGAVDPATVSRPSQASPLQVDDSTVTIDPPTPIKE